MELNELRRAWHRQSTEMVAPLNERELTGMLTRRSNTAIDKLRRNAWWELAVCGVMVLPVPALIYYSESLFMQAYMIVGLLFCIWFYQYYYRRKFKLLRRMNEMEGDLRGHLQQLTQGLRSLLGIYFRLTGPLIVVPLLVDLVYGIALLLAKYSGMVLLKKIALLSLALTVFGALLYWAMVRFMKWYLQRLYGQHLDRLEDYLRELQHE